MKKKNIPNSKYENNNQVLSQFKSWLSGYENTLNQNENISFTNEFLVYIINKSPHSEFKLTLELLKAKILKAGSISKGRPFNLGYSNYHMQYILNQDFLSIQDTSICKLLMTLRTENSKYILEDAIGYNIIEMLIPTKKLYWENTENEPLQKGLDKKLLEKWTVTQGGNYKLKFELEDGGYFTTTSPLIYVDPQKNTIGKVDTELNIKKIMHLARMPVIPIQHLAEISRSLALSIPSLSLPEPIDHAIISNITPQPKLLMSCSPGTNNEIGDFELTLIFTYQKYPISFYPIKKVVAFSENEQIIHITRDLESENQFIQRLTDLGLILRYGTTGNIHIFAKDASFYLEKSTYQAMIEFWKNFQEKEIPKLKEEGWEVTLDKSIHIDVAYVDKWDGNIESEGENDWFSLSFDIEINGKKMALLPLIVQAMKNYEINNLPEEIFLSLGESKFVAVPSKLIKPTLEILYELFDSDYSGPFKLNKRDAARLADLDSLGSITWKGGHELRELGKKIKDFKGIQNVPLPDGFFAKLRDYQQQGLNWLQFLREYKFNGILADDMGLGKTIQTLAHLLIEKNSGRLTSPCLIVAPTSVISNWRNEAQKFAPALKVLVLHGPERSLLFNMIEKQDIVLTTYPLLARDELVLLEKKFHYSEFGTTYDG